MNLTHLADALDHWKGSVIRLLRSEIPDPCVLPMLTDPDNWNFDLFSVYARLLGVDPGMILKKDVQILPDDEREEYFSIDSQFDLFVDPDTGIGDGRTVPEERDRYIMPPEITGLVPNRSPRLLLIYQHAPWGEPTRRPHIIGRVRTLKTIIGKQCVFAYFAGQVSMVFVSRDSARLNRVRQHLENLLGPVARGDGVPGRIID